jgi:hypothetical protein
VNLSTHNQGVKLLLRREEENGTYARGRRLNLRRNKSWASLTITNYFNLMIEVEDIYIANFIKICD